MRYRSFGYEHTVALKVNEEYNSSRCDKRQRDLVTCEADLDSACRLPRCMVAIFTFFISLRRENDVTMLLKCIFECYQIYPRHLLTMYKLQSIWRFSNMAT